MSAGSSEEAVAQIPTCQATDDTTNPKKVGAVKSAQISNKLTTSILRRLDPDTFVQEVNTSSQSTDIAGISSN